MTTLDFNQLANDIKTWGREVGFADVGICDIDLSAYRGDLEAFLEKSFHGEMEYLALI